MDVNENAVVETAEEKTEEEAVEINVEETAEVNTEEVENSEVTEVSEESTEESTTESGEIVSESDDSNESSDESNDTDGGEEVSAMKTTRDISRMIHEALREKNDYADVAMIFPEDKIVLVQNWDMKELEYIQYSYRVDGDKIVLEDEKKVELVVSPLQINSEIEKKNDAIAQANDRIVELENQNAELSKAKEELDTIKENQAKAEHAEAVNKLREYVVKSNRFTEEELSSEKIQNAIEELNEAWLKSEIADRLVASLSEPKSQEIEASEKKDVQNVVAIVLSEEEKAATSEDVMRAFFGND